MQPQGSSVINEAYFAAQRAEVAECAVCVELQAKVDRLFASIKAGLDAAESQVALLTPILALLAAPANPTAAVTWITNFISSFLTPYVVPLTTYTAQLAALTTQVADLTSAVNTAKDKIPGCNITIPPLV